MPLKIDDDHLRVMEDKVCQVVASIGDVIRTSKGIDELGKFSEAQYYRRMREFINRKLGEDDDGK